MIRLFTMTCLFVVLGSALVAGQTSVATAPIGKASHPWTGPGCHDEDATRRDQSPSRPTMHVVGSLAISAGPCTSADFAVLSGSTLVDAIADAGNCLNVLWSFDGDVATVVASANVELVATAITTEATTLLGSAARLESLCYFLQIALFHEFFESSVVYPGTTFAAAGQAMVDIASSPDFLDEAAAVRALRKQWTISIDSANATHLVLGRVENILSRYLATRALASEFDERVTVYNCLFSIARQIRNSGINLGAASPWIGLVSTSLHASVDALALDTQYESNAEYIVENAIYAAGHFSLLDPSVSDLGHATLTAAYNVHGQVTGPWFRAIIDLENFYGSTLADGTVIDLDQVRATVTGLALPNTFVFDQGRLVFRTAVPLATVEAMYDALKEVHAQFFRKAGFLAPVPGDANESVTLVIYASPADYRLYQPFLYGYGTNNGGIFIEGEGTLFTYERTPQESIFSLEELLRHEYVHYLDSRYLVHGGFYGSGTLYQGGRLDWYSEGLAEYLVGATRLDGVLPRGNLLDRIGNDATRMTVADVLSATYADGFGFYRYAGSFFAFLENERPDHFVALFDHVRGDDVAALDALYASWSADAALQTAFDAWLTARIAELNASNGQFAEDVATVPTPTNVSADGAESLRQVIETELVATPSSEFRIWDGRFRFEDTMTLPIGALSAGVRREGFDAAVDGVLGTLEPLASRFTSAVAWCGDIQTAGGVATAHYVVEGPYRATPGDVTPPEAPKGLVVTDGSGRSSLAWQANSEADLVGYQVYRSSQRGGPYSLLNTDVVSTPTFTDVDAPIEQFYVVSAVDASGNESPFSIEIQGGSTGRVLVVSAPSGLGFQSYAQAYTDVLEAMGVTYDLWNPFVDGEFTSATLTPYVDGVVIWSVGYLNSGAPEQLGASRRAIIEDYLDAGGNLIISGAYKAFHLDETTLFTDYLHATHVAFNINLPLMDGVAMNLLGDGVSLAMSSVVYESELDVTSPAASAFVYDSTSGSGATQSSGTAAFTIDGAYKVAYLAFPFRDLDSASRATFLERAFDWMLPPRPVMTVVPAVAGVASEFRVSEAPVGQLTYYLTGTQIGDIVVPCPGAPRVRIDPFVVFDSGIVDVNGVASVTRHVPAGLTGFTLLFQAGIWPSCDLTDPIQITFD